MTQKLEDFFNLDNVESAEQQDSSPIVTEESATPTELVSIQDNILIIKEQLSIADRINEALPQVKGLDADDRAFDDYANKAIESYDKLMDLGFNVDDRNAANIFAAASTMMGNAITAKTAKLDKKLKMIQLQLQAAKLANSKPVEEDTPDSGLTTDRNAILNLISQNLKKDK